MDVGALGKGFRERHSLHLPPRPIAICPSIFQVLKLGQNFNRKQEKSIIKQPITDPSLPGLPSFPQVGSIIRCHPVKSFSWRQVSGLPRPDVSLFFFSTSRNSGEKFPSTREPCFNSPDSHVSISSRQADYSGSLSVADPDSRSGAWKDFSMISKIFLWVPPASLRWV